MARVTFKKLSPNDRGWLTQIMFNPDVSIVERRRRIRERFGISDRTVWTWRANLLAQLRPVENLYLDAAGSRTPTKNTHYIITWAQNATPVHEELWSNMKAYAEKIGAEIHVIPGRYRNPSLIVQQDRLESQEWWDDELTDYLNNRRHELVPGVVLVGDVKIQPTAVNPMRSFEGLVGDKSAIFGHPKMQLQSMPHLPGHATPIHATSLACTIRNYSDTKAGKKGEHKHALGFTIVENGPGIHHIRQIKANADGSFDDLYYRTQGQEVMTNDSCAGFVMGDIHLRQAEFEVIRSATEFMDAVKPDHLVLHDIFDGQSVNHHEANDPFQAVKRLNSNNHLIDEEVEDVVTFVGEMARYNPVLVFSNHCEWLDRHLVSADWKKDIPNAAAYLRLASRKLKIGHNKGLLHDIIDERLPGTITLGPNDSFKIEGWECGAHGHLGVNGARGGMTSFRKFNTRMIFGHFHSTARYSNTVQVGTFTKADMGYNKGPSSWCHAGAVIHRDGQVQQLIFKKDPRDKKGERFSFTTLPKPEKVTKAAV